MEFQDRFAVVTGAGSGIGAVLAERLAAEGARVAVLDIDAEAARDTAERLAGAVAIEVDVTDRPRALAVMAELHERFGAVDVLINNAATCSDRPFAELSADEWQRDLDVSLTGAFTLAQAVLGPMVAAGRGAIVNVASVNAIAYFGNEAYSAAKAGLLSLTRSLAVRYGSAGVRVNAVVPGTIATPIWRDRTARDPAVLDRVARWYPLGRVGTPGDVAEAVLFLASDRASWITGVALPVDGGLLAGNAEMAREIVIGDA